MMMTSGPRDTCETALGVPVGDVPVYLGCLSAVPPSASHPLLACVRACVRACLPAQRQPAQPSPLESSPVRSRPPASISVGTPP